MDLNLGSVSVNELELGYTGAYTGGTVPVLSTVPATAFPGQSRTVTGTDFGATQGTGGVTIGGVAQTITSWADTSVTFTTVLGTNSYGTGKTLELTADAGGSDTDTIELVADTASGFGYVDMSSPNTTDESSVAFNTTPTVVTGDQFEWEDFNTLGNLVIDAEGFVSSVDTEGTFRGRFWDATDSTWGTVETFTAATADTTAPTISSASVPTAGDNIAVQMSESVQVGAGGTGGWTISLGDASVSSAAVDGVDDTIINLTPSRTLTTADTLTISYTQPTDGFQDQADTPNDLATLSGQAVTNNSTQSPPDTIGPVVTSVAVPTADSYREGESLSFTVNWDEAATVTGTPALNLNIGGSARQANYASGTGTTALVFSYTVQAGDNDADGVSITSLTLDGGTIQDAAGNNATLTLNSVGDTSGVLVDTVKPVITPNGANPVNVVVGETYTDAGATATDNIDGSLGAVTGTGTVDTNTIGDYTITYSGAGVVDSAGNVADDATRTIRVVAEDFWPFGKQIKYAANQNWEWGKRHPMTNMRVRIHK